MKKHISTNRKLYGPYRLLSFLYWADTPALFTVNEYTITIPSVRSIARHLGVASVQINEWLMYLMENGYFSELHWSGTRRKHVQLVLRKPPHV